MTSMRIGIVGVAGETGKSIVKALLDAEDINVVALVRPSSLEKPAYKALAARGAEIRLLDLEADIPTIAHALQGIEILISAVGPFDQLTQIPLAIAAKEAGIRRFFPCAAVSVLPAGGVSLLRDEKEKVYNQIKKIGLSYTIVDVGWWYQLAWPRVSSGKLDEYGLNNDIRIVGTGNVPSALTDVRDIGRYFARLVRDERTVDKYVLVYNELWTQNQIWDAMSRATGEEVPKVYRSAADLEDIIAKAKQALVSNPDDIPTKLKLIGTQYEYSHGVRGDNTPEYAKFLGYVTSKDLYGSDMDYVPFEEYLKELVSGQASEIYEDRRVEMKEFLKKAGRG